MSALPFPALKAGAAAPLTLEAIRGELDEVDGQLLALLERRQRLAQRVGLLKSAAPLKLNPAREARVIGRLKRAASPAAQGLVEPVWRELMSAGLNAQQQVTVAVWPGGRDDLTRLARSRFGARAGYASIGSVEEALEAAQTESTVAVLALDGDNDWWVDLVRRPDLWVFDALGARGPLDPVALCIGRVEPESLARGVTYRVAAGGDSGPGIARERVLGVSRGRRLCAMRDPGEAPLPRDQGYIGSATV